MKASILITLHLMLSFACRAQSEVPESICYGTYSQGSLAHGWQLPSKGANFSAYSSWGVMAGRNYVHSKVYDVMLAAYKALESQAPDKYFIYGETGFKKGGKFRPHKTHQNGLSVDFFVPVVDAQSKSIPLPISLFNKLGYNIEFDERARFGDLEIDFEAMARHLLALQQAAEARGVEIRVVIFENAFQTRLMATPTGKSLPSRVKFSTQKPWVRHDEHYHVDFILPCN